MKKAAILSSFILLAAMGVAAQTKPQVANSKTNRETRKTFTTGKKSLRANDPRVLRVGPSTTYLNNGLSIRDVLQVLGRPVAVTERQEAETVFATYTFERGEGFVLVAEFENGRLTGSRTVEAAALAENKDTGN